MLEVSKGGKRSFWREKSVTIDPVEEGVCVVPVSIESVADPEDIGVMFLSEAMNLFVHDAERVNKGGDRKA